MSREDFLAIEPKISVIITYYNLGKYIQDCVNSVLNQDYKNFEIVIVNDNSDEKNFKILRKIAAKNTAIIDLNTHLGQFGSFLKGLEASSGDFVCFLNADDILLPSYFKILAKALIDKPVLYGYSNGSKINEKDELSSMNPAHKQMYKLADKIFYKNIQNLYNNKDDFSLKIGFNSPTPFKKHALNIRCALFRKEVLDILNLYPDINFWQEDAENIVLSILNLLGKSVFVSLFCYLFREHNSYFQNNRDYILKNEKFYSDIVQMLFDNREKLISKLSKRGYLKILLKIALNSNIKICAKIIKTFAHI